MTLAAEDRAHRVVNYRATHWLPGDVDGELWELAGRYEYGLTREGGSWRIAACTIRVTWTAGNRRLVENVRRHAPAQAATMQP